MSEPKFVYTEKGEAHAKEKGLKDRYAGTVAYYGYEPLEPGSVASAWLEKGYIRKATLCDSCTAYNSDRRCPWHPCTICQPLSCTGCERLKQECAYYVREEI